MEITFGTWKLRSWSSDDVHALAKYANNRNVWINLRDRFPHPYGENDAEDWIRHVHERDLETHFAIASSDEAIGGIGLELQGDVAKRSAEMGYWLGEPFWGQGIATMAVAALVEWAFATFDLVRIYAEVFEWNAASARVLEKNGFVLEGRKRQSVTKDGKTIDELMYALIKEG